MTFADRLARGQLGESLISRWLISRGWVVLPAYEVEIDSDKGPRVFALAGSLVSPDLGVIRGGRFLWVEAKHKTVFSWRRCDPGPRWETGIDLHHWQDYRGAADRAGVPVWLLFLHTASQPSPGDARHSPGPCPVGLFGISLRRSERCVRIDPSPRPHARRGMAYWCADDLQLLAPLIEVLPGLELAR